MSTRIETLVLVARAALAALVAASGCTAAEETTDSGLSIDSGLSADTGAGVEDASTLADAPGAPDADDGPAPGECPAGGLAPGDHDIVVMHEGIEHTARVHVPASAPRESPLPLVLFFHGGGGTAEGAEMTVQLVPSSDREGFVLVRPEGFSAPTMGGGVWNAGACCGVASELGMSIDHVGAVRALLDELERRLCVDRRRVFATGHSNGGMMVYRLACELADRIAAVAPNAGFFVDEDLEGAPGVPLFACSPSRAVPLLHMHGLADSCAPYEGGTSGLDPVRRPPVQHGIDVFRTIAGCSSATETTLARGGATCTRWIGCAADVELCTVEGAGHVWPGSDRYPASTQMRCGGATTRDLDANERIWAFFGSHPLR